MNKKNLIWIIGILFLISLVGVLADCTPCRTTYNGVTYKGYCKPNSDCQGSNCINDGNCCSINNNIIPITSDMCWWYSYSYHCYPKDSCYISGSYAQVCNSGTWGNVCDGKICGASKCGTSCGTCPPCYSCSSDGTKCNYLCSSEQVCGVNNQCITCNNQCQLNQITCKSSEEYVGCISDENGCLNWNLTSVKCDAGNVCYENSCVPIIPVVCGNNICESGESKYNCLADCKISGWTTVDNGWKLTSDKHVNGTKENIVLTSTDLNLQKGKTYKISASIFNPTDCDAYLEFDGLKIYSDKILQNFKIVEGIKELSNQNKQLNLWIGLCSNSLLQSQGILFDNVSIIEINESPDIPTVFDTYDFTQQGCCPANWCWNGTGCMNASLWEQTDYPAVFTTGSTSGYRCIAGKWIYSEVKWNWDHTDAQFCPSNNHCFVSKDAGCIGTGSYVEDHYCWEGNWSSRTKFMAMQLLQFAKDNSYSEYTLQCDNYENALNDYFVEQQYFVAGQSGIQIKLINNFCVLKYTEDKKEKVIIGTSFNDGFIIQNFLKNITNTTENYCDDAIDNGNFSSCGDGHIWYNADKKIVLYGKESFTLIPPADWMTKFLGWLGETFGFVHTDLLNLDLTMNVTDFNKIYISRLYSDCDKSIFAVQELKSNQQTYHLQYHNFVADICSEINSKYQGTFICNLYNNGKSGINQIVKPYGVITLNDNLWQDLTSKLKIKDGACPKTNIALTQ